MTPDEIKLWRKGERARLIAQRVAMPDEERGAKTESIIAILETVALGLDGPVSFYWPFRGEPNLRPLMRRLVAKGKTVALPVVLQKGHPLEFRPWTPGCDMELGIWNIPIPDTKQRVIPTMLVAPVVGFDRASYRLGYGGGYFDRTLAALGDPKYVFGVGFDCQAIETIHPLPHDIRMDRVLTESGVAAARPPQESVAFSSPACSLAEAPDAYAGYLDEADIAAELLALRASPVLRGEEIARALDRVMQRLPAQAAGSGAPGDAPTSVTDRLARLRARVRDDALHAALDDVLRLAKRAEGK